MITGSDQALLPPLALWLQRLGHLGQPGDTGVLHAEQLARFSWDHLALPACCYLADVTHLGHRDPQLPQVCTWHNQQFDVTLHGLPSGAAAEENESKTQQKMCGRSQKHLRSSRTPLLQHGGTT